MLYSFDESSAPERHDLQYFEMFGNRGIYFKGWSAVTKHKTPWIMMDPHMGPFDDDVWELYDGNSDFSQARNLAAEQPERLATETAGLVRMAKASADIDAACRRVLRAKEKLGLFGNPYRGLDEERRQKYATE